MSDRCSCVPGPHYRCGAGRSCDVHGSVEALMAWGEYVDRRLRMWRQAQEFILPDGTSPWVLAGRGITVTPAQMRLRIVREQHREVCPGLKRCYKHPAPHVVRVGRPGGRVFAIYGSPDGQAQPDQDTLAEAIDAAQQLAKETT